MLDLAIREQVADVHFSVGAPPMLRVDGELRAVEADPLDAETISTMMEEISPAAALEAMEEHGSGEFGYEHEGGSRFRVSIFQQMGQPGMVLRLIPQTIYSFQDLGLPDRLKEICRDPWGLVLVTGPTGAGKTTTLATFIDYVNRRFPYHIVTLEDPIEFRHEHEKGLVTQREHGRDFTSFQRALRSVVRMDPDVILVGEMRDSETIRATITAAETGHLVFATLHTNSAPSTINRIIDTFPREEQSQVRAQLSLTLSAVVSQTLLPRRDGNGRVAAFEIMLANSGIRNMIREGKEKNLHSAIQTGGGQGMWTLDQHLLQLYREGTISAEVALANANDPASVRGALETAESSTAESHS